MDRRGVGVVWVEANRWCKLDIQGVEPKGDTEGQSKWQKGSWKSGNACGPWGVC